MEYTEELLLRLDGLGITMSNGPEATRKQLDNLYEDTRFNTFGYLEHLDKFDKIFEPVYGLEFFILVRDVRDEFYHEYRKYMFMDLKEDLNEIANKVRDVAREPQNR
jgi:hypothetical protein